MNGGPVPGRRPALRVDAVTIFPDYFAPLRLSIIGRAIESGLIDLRVHDLRDFTHDRHRTVDDTPYGGGAGMVMRAEPWGEALDAVLASMSPTGDGTGTNSPETNGPGENGPGNTPEQGHGPRGSGSSEDGSPAGGPVLVFPSPSGLPFTQDTAAELAARDALVFACGRYEGIDRRVLDWAAGRVEVRELSLGDYVLAGGEAAALAMIEAVVRLVPGVLGNPGSLVEESYSPASGGLLEYPVYTKPASWRGLDVPPVLLSGDHGRVAAWRAERSVELTRERRPELLDRNTLTD